MTRPTGATLAAGACFRAVRSDSRLSEAFLPQVTVEEEAAITALLDAVVADADRWCDRWTLFNPKTILPLAMLTCVQFPHLPVEQVSLSVKSSLWVYALDDLIDDGGIPHGELPLLLDECLEVARTGRVAANLHELAMSLGELRAQLSAQPLWHPVFPAWLTTLHRLVEGMVREHAAREQLRTDGSLLIPLSLDEYLMFAAHSIGLPHQWVTGLAMEPDPSIADSLPSLVGLAERCGLVMRLANDGATWCREEVEGGVNAVRLERWSCDAAMSPAAALSLARHRVRGRMNRELQICRNLAAAMSGGSSVAQRFVRATEFGVGLYARHDFRTWTAEVTHALIGGHQCP